jgi:glycosyltransferase involved in cell wall biosynthesis
MAAASGHRVISRLAPQVSVVIPTYNRAEKLRRCLESLCGQTHRSFEVLVCDDASSDHTADVVDEFRAKLDITLDCGAHFGGPARPRNRGIERARGAYIAFLDSDDWWSSEKLQKSMECLKSGADIVFHDLWRATRIGQHRYRKRAKSYQPDAASTLADLMIRGNALPLSSVVVRSECIRAIDGFSEDPGLVSVEDYDCWLRLAERGSRFIRSDSCLGYYWRGGGNITPYAGRPTANKYELVYKRHAGRLKPQDRRRAKGVLAYNCGRVHYLRGELRSSRLHLRKCLSGGAPGVYRLKALALLIAVMSKSHPVE